MFSLILVIILYLSNVCVVKSMFVQHVLLITLKYKIIMGYEHVLQNNFIPLLIYSLHQLQVSWLKSFYTFQMYFYIKTCVCSRCPKHASHSKIIVGYEWGVQNNPISLFIYFLHQLQWLVRTDDHMRHIYLIYFLFSAMWVTFSYVCESHLTHQKYWFYEFRKV